MTWYIKITHSHNDDWYLRSYNDETNIVKVKRTGNKTYKNWSSGIDMEQYIHFNRLAWQSKDMSTEAFNIQFSIMLPEDLFLELL